MFEFGRELRRIFSGARSFAPNHDGFIGGDATLLELLDLTMLKAEAKSADIAAGRISAKDRPQRQLEAAIVWRELARRTGDAVALRKAAAGAERAADSFGEAHRQQGWARARVEQARCALLGAELFGDKGLDAAAERAAGQAHRTGGAAGMLALAMLVEIKGRRAVLAGSLTETRAAVREFNDPIATLEQAGRRESTLKLAAAELRIARAEMLSGAGQRLKDESLLRAACGDLAAAAERLDTTYEPLTLGRIAIARAATRAALAEMTGDVAGLAKAIGELAAALDAVARDHSPLDWATGQATLAQALSQLGEATASEAAFDKAVAGFDRAALALEDAPGLLLRAQVAAGRGLCLARCAELTGDLGTLDAAEAAFKTELIAGPHRQNPVAWAMLQVQLGQLYATRLSLTGKDRGERAAAALAFQSAMDVFGEEGLRSFTAIAADGLERLAAVRVG